MRMSWSWRSLIQTTFNMAFTLPALPYDYTALEPYVDVATMQIHHTKHHQVL